MVDQWMAKLSIWEMGVLMRNEVIHPSALSSMRSSRGLSTSSYCRKRVLARKGRGVVWTKCSGKTRMRRQFCSHFSPQRVIKKGAFCDFYVTFSAILEPISEFNLTPWHPNLILRILFPHRTLEWDYQRRPRVKQGHGRHWDCSCTFYDCLMPS